MMLLRDAGNVLNAAGIRVTGHAFHSQKKYVMSIIQCVLTYDPEIAKYKLKNDAHLLLKHHETEI